VTKAYLEEDRFTSGSNWKHGKIFVTSSRDVMPTISREEGKNLRPLKTLTRKCLSKW
jgi:hypothetical protein